MTRFAIWVDKASTTAKYTLLTYKEKNPRKGKNALKLVIARKLQFSVASDFSL